MAKKYIHRLVYITFALFLLSCGSGTDQNKDDPPSDIVLGDPLAGSPIPFSENFWGDEQQSLEIYVYSKQRGISNPLLEQYQVDRQSMSVIILASLEGISLQADYYLGDYQNGMLVNAVPLCTNDSTDYSVDFNADLRGQSFHTTYDNYTYILRSVDAAGSTLTLIGERGCGELTAFPFEAIDGQTPTNNIALLITILTDFPIQGPL